MEILGVLFGLGVLGVGLAFLVHNAEGVWNWIVSANELAWKWTVWLVTGGWRKKSVKQINYEEAAKALIAAKKQQHSVLTNDWIRDFGETARPILRQYRANAIVKETWDEGKYSAAYSCLKEWRTDRDTPECRCIDCYVNMERKQAYVRREKMREIAYAVRDGRRDLYHEVKYGGHDEEELELLRQFVPDWYYSKAGLSRN